ncbi:competence protein TfoX [Salmonella enterica]|nr:competence protein TfoX [Salmonella enterica]EEH4705669.1 competence protein TfoX [Salmonella enterica]
MASRQSTVDFIVEQLSLPHTISVKKMFGEYGIYCDEKMVALVCDDLLFVKPTLGGKAFLGKEYKAMAPYPGAKPSFVISGEKWDEYEWLSQLIIITYNELPQPKKKTK